jgi:putative DNA primase/helicase
MKGAKPMSDTANVVTEYEKVDKALGYINPNCPRETWVRICTAIKTELGQDGFDLFDRWSSQGERYNAQAVRDVWKSVKPGTVSIATLYHEAKQSGFNPAEWKTQTTPLRDDGGKRAAERAAAQAAQAVEDAKRHAEAAQKAERIFMQGASERLDNLHPYLIRKGLNDSNNAMSSVREMDAADLADRLGYIPKANGVPLEGRVLMIPVGDRRNFTTLEFIDEQGRKTALAGGLKKGSWSTPMPASRENMALPADAPFVVAEGFATASSLQLAMSKAYIVAAGSDTNLGNVARSLREHYPGAPIVIAADIGNPASMELARKAAASVDGVVIAPEFSDGQREFLTQHLGKAPTDFNDQLVYYKNHPDYINRPVRMDEQFFDDVGRALYNAQTPTRAEFPDLTPPAATSPADRAISIREAASSGETKMDASTEAPEVTAEAPAKAPYERPKIGDPLYNIKSLPDEVKKAAQEIFGNRQTLYAPKENGGPYNGEIREVSGYLIQEVGPRSLVVHEQKSLEFVSDRHKWMQENRKINGQEVAIWYKGDEAKVFPYDRVREDMKAAVGSFKKSAKEMGLSPEFANQLDKTFEKSMERINGLRQDAREKSKDARNVAREAKTDAERAVASPARM